MNITLLIDKVLQDEQKLRKTRGRSGKWSPSGFGRCFRFQYWNRKNEPITNPPDARALRKFKSGKIFHDFVEGLLPEHQTEVKVEKDDIFGYADIVFKNKVIDIKSAHSNDFKRFWSKGIKEYDVYKEKETNWIQVATYAWILGKKWCGLYFVGRDDLTTEQFEATTDKFMPLIEAELKTLREYWEKGLPPAAPRTYNGSEGKYCSYTDKCKNLGWDCISKKEVEK